MILAEARRGAVDGAWLSNFPFRLPHVLAGHSGLGRGRPQFALHLTEVTATFAVCVARALWCPGGARRGSCQESNSCWGDGFPGPHPVRALKRRRRVNCWSLEFRFYRGNQMI